MDEKSARKLQRSLSFLKVFMVLSFLTLLAGVAILGFIAYKVVTFSRHVDRQITQIQSTTQQKLDLKTQLCNSNLSPAFKAQLCQ